MCGIIGYVGPRECKQLLLAGLERLEYRGYDSAGIAIVHDGELVVAKRAGKLANLEKELADRPLPAAHTGIGCASFGSPSKKRPKFSCSIEWCVTALAWR